MAFVLSKALLTGHLPCMRCSQRWHESFQWQASPQMGNHLFLASLQTYAKPAGQNKVRLAGHVCVQGCCLPSGLLFSKCRVEHHGLGSYNSLYTTTVRFSCMPTPILAAPSWQHYSVCSSMDRAAIKAIVAAQAVLPRPPSWLLNLQN